MPGTIVLEVSAETFDEVKRGVENAGMLVGASRIEIAIELLKGDPRDKDIELTLIENAFRSGFGKGRCDPNLDAAWKGFRATLPAKYR